MDPQIPATEAGRRPKSDAERIAWERFGALMDRGDATDRELLDARNAVGDAIEAEARAESDLERDAMLLQLSVKLETARADVDVTLLRRVIEEALVDDESGMETFDADVVAREYARIIRGRR